jgi:hypothetical protein
MPSPPVPTLAATQDANPAGLASCVSYSHWCRHFHVGAEPHRVFWEGPPALLPTNPYRGNLWVSVTTCWNVGRFW